MNKPCKWCKKNDRVPTNAHGWCKECEDRDRSNPPEQSIHQEEKRIHIDLKPEPDREPVPNWPFPWME